MDGSFIATFLETVTIVVMYYGWADITKGELDFDFTSEGGTDVSMLPASWDESL